MKTIEQVKQKEDRMKIIEERIRTTDKTIEILEQAVEMGKKYLATIDTLSNKNQKLKCGIEKMYNESGKHL